MRTEETSPRLEASTGRIRDDMVRFEVTQIELPELGDRRLAQALTPGSQLVETLRVLCAKVESLGAQRRLRCIGVVAATAGEGATLTAMGLASTLARRGTRRVLLLEAALRAPAIESLLGLDGSPGLSEWLAGGAVGPAALRRIEPWGFSLLSAGGACDEPAPLLESPDLAHLLEGAGRAFDFVVVDCPPLVPVADSVLIQDLLDGYLLVVRARKAGREQILQAVSQLKPERLRGVVFNDLREMFARSQPLSADRRG